MAIQTKDLTVQLALAGVLVFVGFLAYKGRSGIDADVLGELKHQDQALDVQESLVAELRADIAARRPRVTKESLDEASARLAPLLVSEAEARALVERLRTVCRAHAKGSPGPDLVREREPRALGDDAKPRRFTLPVDVELDLEWADVEPFMGELQGQKPGLLAFESASFDRGPFPLVHAKLSLSALYGERRP